MKKVLDWARFKVFRYIARRTGLDEFLLESGIKDLDAYYKALISLANVSREQLSERLKQAEEFVQNLEKNCPCRGIKVTKKSSDFRHSQAL